jgi:hypothetical protein
MNNHRILRAITGLGPEPVTSYAFGEYLHARRLLAELRTAGIAQESWTPAHAFYLGMDCVRYKTLDGFEFGICTRSKTGDGWEYPTCNPGVIKLRFSGHLKDFDLTTEDIQDRSKADAFSKTITVIQVTWFFVNSIARAIVGLPLCPLEISTMAYVFCTCITYAFWWSKPKDITTTLKVPCNFAIADLPEDFHASMNIVDDEPRISCHPRWQSFHLSETEAEVLSIIRGRYPALMGIAVGVSFCAIHIAAWNYDFPTRAEKIMWRVCSLGSSTIPLLCLSFVFLRKLNPKAFDDVLWPLVFVCYCIMLSCYIAARFVTIALLFSTLRLLPDDSFVAINWAKVFPHI